MYSTGESEENILYQFRLKLMKSRMFPSELKKKKKIFCKARIPLHLLHHLRRCLSFPRFFDLERRNKLVSEVRRDRERKN